MPGPFYDLTAKLKLRMLRGISEAKDIDAGFHALGEDIDAVLSAGAWTPLPLGPNVEELPTWQQPAYRLEPGDTVVRLRGGVKVKAGKTLPPTGTIGTLPAGFAPPANVGTLIVGGTGATPVGPISVANSGVIQWTGPELAAGSPLYLDGVTFNIV